MEKKTFNVKNESAQAFFQEYAIELSKASSPSRDINPYYLMRDKLYIKKNGNLKVGDLVYFELKDITEGSKKELINHYQYEVKEYDDVSFMLELVKFIITTA